MAKTRVVIEKPENACVAFKNCKDRDCDKCEFNKNSESEKALSGENENADQQAEVTEKTKDGQSAETLPAIPPEYINYRVALKDFLSQKCSLEYSISSYKAQLKAVEKRIEEMNKQFANGEYTGELFSQDKNEAPIEASQRPLKREDGPEYDAYLVLAGEKFSELTDKHYLNINDEEILEASLLDFITSNPDSETARLFYMKVSFYDECEDGEYDEFDIEYDSERSDFTTSMIAEKDREKHKVFVEKWQKIQKERHEELEKLTENAAPKTKKGGKK